MSHLPVRFDLVHFQGDRERVPLLVARLRLLLQAQDVRLQGLHVPVIASSPYARSRGGIAQHTRRSVIVARRATKPSTQRSPPHHAAVDDGLFPPHLRMYAVCSSAYGIGTSTFTFLPFRSSILE